MKKTKFMIGALVLSMGLLGTGYALWTDTLAVDATVNTGNLNMQFVNLDKEDNYMNNMDGEVDGKYTTFNSEVALDKGTTVGDVNNENDKINITINDMVPGASTIVTADMVNDGTVAAKLNKITLKATGSDTELHKDLHVTVKMRNNNNTKDLAIVYEGTVGDLIANQEGEITPASFGTDIVFVPGKADNDIDFEMKIVMNENAKNATQEKNIALTADFEFEQAFEPTDTELTSN